MRLFFVSVEPFGGHRSRYFLYIFFIYFFVKENGREYRTFNNQEQNFKAEGWPLKVSGP
jgi:hypothetical protein